MNGTKKRVNKSKSSCCVPECTVPGYVLEDGKKVTFHSLPMKNDKLLNEWIVKIKRDVGPKFTVTKHTKICSRHFTDKDFSVTATSRRVLKKNAIPTIFPWNKPTRFRRVLQRGVLENKGVETETNAEASDMEQTLTTEDELRMRIQQLEVELKVHKEASGLFQKQRDEMKVVIQKQFRVEQKRKHNSFSLEQFKNCDVDICFYMPRVSGS